ncbi:MAG: D-aminoacyl-tRNA deacylase [Rubripirellula sp.]
MKTVIQRVKSASVTVDGETIGAIDHGLLVLLGVEHGDTDLEVQWLTEKISQLRIFDDHNGKMNLSVLDVKGSILIVSQFTLLADCRRGRRPAFTNAADPKLANQLYQNFIESIGKLEITTQSGRFAADMQVSLINDGPVTLLVDREPSG